jgi:hypothetical protein
MMSVGGVELGDNMILSGLDADRVAITVERSDEGVAQILIANIEGGERLELEGYITFETEERLLALSASGVPVELIHPRRNGSVLIEGVTMEDWVGYNNPLPSDWRVGTIRLIGV